MISSVPCSDDPALNDTVSTETNVWFPITSTLFPSPKYVSNLFRTGTFINSPNPRSWFPGRLEIIFLPR